ELHEGLRELLAQLCRGPPGVAAMGFVEPAPETGLPFPAGLVHAVVHDAAEGVERVDRAALVGGKDAERVVEVRPALARDARGEGGRHRFQAARAGQRSARQTRRALPIAPCRGRRRKTSSPALTMAS